MTCMSLIILQFLFFLFKQIYNNQHNCLRKSQSRPGIMKYQSAKVSPDKLNKRTQNYESTQNLICRKMLEIPIGNSSRSRNMLNLADSATPASCENCRLLTSKINDLLIVSNQITCLKQKNNQFKEQVQFLFENFKYILELAIENINKGVRQKTKKIFSQKQFVIQKQMKIIQRLENQTQLLMNKLDANIEYIDKMQDMEKKIQQLQKQNSFLRSLTQKLQKSSKQQNFSFLIPSTKDQEIDYQMKQLHGLQSSRSSNQLKSVNKAKPCFTLKKMKTMQLETQKQQKYEQLHKKSLDHLRLKIHKIKQEIISSKVFIQ